MKKIAVTIMGLFFFSFAIQYGGNLAEEEQNEEHFPTIIGWNFFENLTTMQGLDLSKRKLNFEVTVLNNGKQASSFLVLVTVLNGNEVEFAGEEQVLFAPPKSLQKVMFKKFWSPKKAGEYSANISVISLDKRTKFAELNDTFSFSGKKDYELKAECVTDTVAAGSDFIGKIFLKNTGDYFEDILLSMQIENSSENILKGTSTSLALKPAEEKILTQSIYISAGTKSAKYALNASVYFNGQKKQDSCAFFVKKKTIFDNFYDFVSKIFS
ncbi:MAG: hypothetical protein HYW50_03400 [Candidatus Diapherotrites archaeon]|nr:hypothetical protein [Candidatus Diapherotrites archaeon]